MKHKRSIINKKEKKVYTYFLVVVAVLFIGSTIFSKYNPFEILLEQGEFWRFLTVDFFPPTLQNSLNIFESILITIEMAIGATFISGILALFFAMFGSEYISPVPKLSKVIRAIATFLRNIPALVWAFILFSALGIGTGVGFVALVISTFAFMTRAFIEVIDDISHDAIEGLSVVGSTFWQRVFQGVIPSCMQDFLAWFLYCIEVNIRASTIVGMVGGGGVGLVLFSYLKSFKYQTAAGIILIIAATIILVDLLTGYLRKKVLL
ncbi:MAG TPA: ABC transporter permease subunit [Ruminiclostridium sp.]